MPEPRACTPRGRGTPDRIPDPAEVASGHGGRHVLAGTGNDARPGGRERFGQDGLGAGDHGPLAGRGVPGDRFDPVRATRAHHAQPGRPAQAPRERDRHDLPGAHDEPESGVHGGQPDRRTGARTPRHQPRRRLEGRGRDARPGGDPPGGHPGGGLSARVLGRDAPARHDRHGPVLLAQAADRRRADDGARRDDAGADHRVAAHAPA